MRKVVVSLLVLVLVLSSCAKPADDTYDKKSEAKQTEEKKTESAAKEEKTEASKEASEEALKIAILTCPSGIDDGSFNQNNYEGILAFLDSYKNAVVTDVQESSGSPEAAINALNEIVADHDVFVLPGFQFSGVSSVAIENPDKKFILVDATPTPIDEQKDFENVLAYVFKEQESGFLAGVAAAGESKEGKVAVVNGIAFPSNVNYQYGFMAGVNYSNKKYGTNVEIVELASQAGTDVTGANVGGNYIGDFNDPATGKFVGEQLLSEGVDIILVAAGNSGNGVFTAVKEAGEGKYVIGCDVDQYDDGANGDSNIMKTSALKVMDINVKRGLEAIVDGSFKGGTMFLGADSDSTGLVVKDGRNQLSEETKKRVAQCYDLIKKGDIVPPANFNGSTPTEFKGLE